MIEHVAVLIPARDEQDRIEECLRSVVVAKQHSPTEVSITVVADNCTDDTARIARSIPGVHVIEITAGNVGIARRVAAEHALEAVLLPPASVWLANTDADSMVPINWLTSHLGYAQRGYDVIVGTVRADPREGSVAQETGHPATHLPGANIGNIYGANLGCRASAYLEIGGFRPYPEHEDVDLVTRLSAYRQIATAEAEVITSARLDGRTPGGYAGYLREQLEQTLR